MDHLKPEERSKVMARIRGKDTRPEMIVRKAAHALGLRFRLHRKEMKGKPDLIFPKHKVALFVHGCFWHQHPSCKRATMPASRKEFWERKLTGNVVRDRETLHQLTMDGWNTEVIWECETKQPDHVRQRLKRIFFGRRKVLKSAA